MKKKERPTEKVEDSVTKGEVFGRDGSLRRYAIRLKRMDVSAITAGGTKQGIDGNKGNVHFVEEKI